MKNNIGRTFLIIFLVIFLVTCSLGSGVVAGHYLWPNKSANPTDEIQPTQPSGTNNGSQELEDLFIPFWEAWNIVHENYVDQPVDDKLLMEGAIRGMMEALGDEHSSYMDAQEYEDATTQLEGSYAGIGAYVDTEGDFLTIVRPIPGSPAEAAGLQADDKIIAVDGDDVTGVDPAAVRLKVLGEPGTQVILTIQRGDEEPFDVTIIRAVITIPSVESEMLENEIGYIKISVFGDNTADDFHSHLDTIMEQDPQGLIIDLRDNTGGYLDAAVSIASEFIPNGVILYEQFGDGTKIPYEANSGGLATNFDLPLIVIVNGYSASASEIVAGAIQDTGRGILLGETTYGKGSVQNWIPLSNDEGAVRVTIARWLTPNERTIDQQGLTPDMEVEMTNDDYNAGLDPQLDAAIEWIMNP